MLPLPHMHLADLIQGVTSLAPFYTPNAKALAQPVLSVTLDSRRVHKGSIFIAAKGVTQNSQDGHAFIAQALQSGAIALVVENITAVPKHISTPVFTTSNARLCTAKLAEKLYGNPSSRLQLAGVTGTNGKTTVTFLVQSMLQAASKHAGVLGTLGVGTPQQLQPTGFTTPEAEDISKLFSHLVQDGFEAVCMEVSSHALATHRVDGLTFQAAGFTNLSVDHLDFHHSLEAYREAKDRLFLELLSPKASCVLPFGHHLTQRLSKNRLLTWGLTSQADIQATHVVCNAGVTSMNLTIESHTTAVECPFVGEFNVENILCAAGLAYALGTSLEHIAQGLFQAKPPPGRLERVPLKQGPYVFIDYAHTPDALERVLTTLRVLTPGKLVVVFGCGGDRDPTKRPMMGEIASLLADEIVITDDNPRSEAPQEIRHAIIRGLRPGAKAKEIGDRAHAIEHAILNADQTDVVLIAGKGHEQTQIMGTKAIPFSDMTQAMLAGAKWQ